MSAKLTQERLKELLHYDPETGEFTWQVDRGLNVKAGDAAGYTGAAGYRVIGVLGKNRRAHRVAFLYMTGDWPDYQVDHKDGDRLNNRWANLRACTSAQNMQNFSGQGMGKASATALLGAFYCPMTIKSRPYMSAISVGKVKHYLGYFSSAEDAHKAYLAAKARLHTFQPVPRESTCAT